MVNHVPPRDLCPDHPRLALMKAQDVDAVSRGERKRGVRIGAFWVG